MATSKKRTPVSGLTKAPNAGKHPAAPSVATPQPYDVPLPLANDTSIAEQPQHEPRRSFDEPAPPIPLAQFNAKIDPALLHRFRRTAKRRDVSIQAATSEAMRLWLAQYDR